MLGGAFYVMGQVRGRVPTDQPPYHAGGWMTEASPAERAAIWWGGIETLATIHRLDYRALGFGFARAVQRSGRRLSIGSSPTTNAYLEWAARGRPQPTAEAAFDWLSTTSRAASRRYCRWGDARIGNIIYDGTTPAAVLDWEMVTLGSPEMDLAWSIFLDRHHSEGLERPAPGGLSKLSRPSRATRRSPAIASATCTITRSSPASASPSS